MLGTSSVSYQVLGHHKLSNKCLVTSNALLTVGAPQISYQLLGHFKYPINCWALQVSYQ
ncbi:hypothetical protein BgiMline_003923, partial [Biomphalaria glabrata]